MGNKLHTKKGKLTVIAGPMFSGKTGKLIAIIDVFSRMGHTVLTVKPDIDTRYSTKKEIHSHDHQTSHALVINDSQFHLVEQTLEGTGATKIIFDEVQFFHKEKVLTLIIRLKKQGMHIIAAGLLYDYLRKPFGATSDLMGLADERLELFSICQRCGSLARHSERIAIGRVKRVDVGAGDKYIAVCESCHRIHA